MRLFRTTIDIDAPPSRVWAVMSDIERWPEWTASMSSIQQTSDGPLGVGSTARVTQPRLAPANFVVTRWEPGRGFDWTTKNIAVGAIGRHLIEAAAHGSRVTLSVEFSGPLAWLVARLYGDLTRRYVQTEADGLKARSERQASVPE
jgi:hypothetical protein